MPIAAPIVGFDVLMLGLLSIAFLYFTKPVWMPFMVWLLSQIPLIGGWVASQATNLVESAAAWIAARAAQVIQVPIDFIYRIETRTRGFLDSVLSSIRSTYNALVYLTTLAIPAAIATMTAYVEARIVQINAVIAAAGASAVAYVEARIVQINAVIASTLSAAQAYVDARTGPLTDWINGTIANLTGLAAADLATAEAFTTSALATAEADAAAAVGLVASADAAALAGLRGLVDQGFLDGAAALAAAEADAKALAAALSSNALVSALAATGVVAVGLEAIRELECIKLCAPISLLGNAVEALDLAALLLLVAEASTHPKETADFVQATVAPMIDVGTTLYHDLGGA